MVSQMLKAALKYIGFAGAVLGILMGLEALGVALTPWETRAHASETYSALELDQRVLLLDLRARLERIETCLITKQCGLYPQEEY